VDRTVLRRHRDVLVLVHAAELEPSEQQPLGLSHSDLANVQARNVRLPARIW